MQDKFGKKLEEARIRRGVSIRQASDDLKIRPDFLLSFENDHGNFQMPNVYKCGFIKLYARYLKLDTEEISNDFNAYHQNDTRKGRQKEEREHFGRIDFVSTEPTSVIQNTLDFNASKDSEEPQSEEFASNQNQSSYSSKKNNYIKIGLISGSVVAGLLLIILVVNSFLRPSGATTPIAAQQQAIDAAKYAIEKLILSGEDNIHVVVRQEHDKQRLFAGNIDKDHPVTVIRKGPVKIHFSDGSKLTVQKPDGKKINPEREGIGWIGV